MIIGVPREIKDHEYRVGLTPSSVRDLVWRGHTLLVERGAGAGLGVLDAAYRDAGAELVSSANDIFGAAELVVKVKEPQKQERRLLRPGQVLFTYLHLAADRDQAAELLESGAICIAYETVTSPEGGLPLLAPMSEIAGRMSVQAGASALERVRGGRGVLLGGVPGVAPAKVVVLGGGIAGTNAVMIALGMGADVVVFDRSVPALRRLEARFGSRLKTLYSLQEIIDAEVRLADLVIGAVLVPGASAPKLVSRSLVKQMRPGAVLVDVAIDQGGCFESSRPTTHSEPVYVEDGVVHYCVANIPGAVALTSTQALNHATLPFVHLLAEKSWQKAVTDNVHLRDGLNIVRGRMTHPAVAESLGYPYQRPLEAISAN